MEPTVLCVLIALMLPAANACSCGDVTYDSDVEEAELKSPNYPALYCSNLDCTWLIEAGPAGTAIQLVFEAFNTEKTHDYVLISQLEDGESVALEKISGSGNSLAPLVSADGNGFELWFHTDGSVAQSGWRARFRRFNTSTEAAACPRVRYTVNEEQRAIMSPGYPNNAGAMRCYYLLTAQGDPSQASRKAVKFSLPATTFEFTGSLQHMWLFEHEEKLMNGTHIQRPVKIIESATEVPLQYISRGWHLLVIYQTTETAGSGGFQAGVVITDSPCRCELTSQQVTTFPTHVLSPGYPNQDYCDSLSCQWDFKCPNGKWTQFRLNDFESELNVDALTISESAAGDQLVKYSGRLNSGPYGMMMNSSGGGSGLDVYYTLSNTQAHLNFSTDKSMTAKGFNVTVDCVDACSQACPSPQPNVRVGSLNTQDKLELDQPNDCHFIDCIYSLKAPQDGHFSLLLNVSFSPVDGGFLQFMPSALRRVAPAVSMQTAETHRELRYDKATNVDIHYHSAVDPSLAIVGKRGFSIEYEWKERCNCDDDAILIAEETEKNLTSPDYPMPYCEMLNCKWQIRAKSPGHTVQFRLTDFRTENQYDALTLMNSDQQQRLGRYTGLVYMAPVRRSNGRSMYVEFTSDPSVEYRGFHGTYRSIAPPTVTTTTTQRAQTLSVVTSRSSGSSWLSTVAWLLVIAITLTLIGSAYYYFSTGDSPLNLVFSSRPSTAHDAKSYSRSNRAMSDDQPIMDNEPDII